MSTTFLRDEQVAEFERNGYILVRQLFDGEEMEMLRAIGKADAELASQIRVRHDTQGGETKLSLSNDLGDNIYSAIVRCHRVVDTMEQVLEARSTTTTTR